MEKPESKRGGFFGVAPETWTAACDLGMNEAVAYLVLAQGTAGNNISTSWSAESLHKYTGITWERGKAAIGRLIQKELLRYGANHAPNKPRYELISPTKAATERYRINLAATSEEDRRVLSLLFESPQPKLKKSWNASLERLVMAGLANKVSFERYVPVKPPSEDQAGQAAALIWLPNTLVTGTGEGETAPIKRIRQTGDVWTLRLLVDLYSVHNLRDDGGITPVQLHQKFERKPIAQFGTYTIWAFKPEQRRLNWTDQMKVHRTRPKLTPQDDHPIWASIHSLVQTGLLSFVPHVWDNDPTQEKAAAEILYPYGITGHGGEAIEMEIGKAAHAAGDRMAFQEKVAAAYNEGFYHLCPVRSSISNACMVGVARLRYRPHTTRTGAWMTNLIQNRLAILSEFEALKPDRSAA